MLVLLLTILLLTIDNTPAVLATTNLLSSNDNGLFGTDNGKWNEILNNQQGLCTVKLTLT
jgi:hypothetical protein